MEDLIKALTILMKYLNNKNAHAPTHCEHDVLYIMKVKREDVNVLDHAELEALGFHWSEDDENYQSFRFGSA